MEKTASLSCTCNPKTPLIIIKKEKGNFRAGHGYLGGADCCLGSSVYLEGSEFPVRVGECSRVVRYLIFTCARACLFISR
jgi:hypothetical protein